MGRSAKEFIIIIIIIIIIIKVEIKRKINKINENIQCRSFGSVITSLFTDEETLGSISGSAVRFFSG